MKWFIRVDLGFIHVHCLTKFHDLRWNGSWDMNFGLVTDTQTNIQTEYDAQNTMHTHRWAQKNKIFLWCHSLCIFRSGNLARKCIDMEERFPESEQPKLPAGKLRPRCKWQCSYFYGWQYCTGWVTQENWDLLNWPFGLLPSLVNYPYLLSAHSGHVWKTLGSKKMLPIYINTKNIAQIQSLIAAQPMQE